MVRTPGFHPGNRGFESRRDHHGFEFLDTPVQGVFFVENAIKLLTNDVQYVIHNICSLKGGRIMAICLNSHPNQQEPAIAAGSELGVQ